MFYPPRLPFQALPLGHFALQRRRAFRHPPFELGLGLPHPPRRRQI